MTPSPPRYLSMVSAAFLPEAIAQMHDQDESPRYRTNCSTRSLKKFFLSLLPVFLRKSSDIPPTAASLLKFK